MLRPLFALVATLVATLVASLPAAAYPGYGSPPLTSGAVDCVDCHTSAPATCSAGTHPRTPCLNPFGKAYRADGWSDAVQAADTDGDGFPNSGEVEADGSAGFHRRAEERCDMATCAEAGGAYALCSANVRCRATFSSSPVASYSFLFSCRPGTSGNTSGTGPWTCVDVQECADNPCGEGTCVESSLSAWAFPGYICSCHLGYVSQGGTCVLGDECLAALDDCDPAASCVDEGGGEGDFSCACPAGMVGDGHISGTGCTELDPCAETPCAPGCEVDACFDAGVDGGEADGRAADGGAADRDGGRADPDSGHADSDGGVAEADAGGAVQDAGLAPLLDAGLAPLLDAGVGPVDAGAPPLVEDAGDESDRDAGGTDSTPPADAGVASVAGGCACNAAQTRGADVVVFTLLGLCLGLRRRKRTDRA